MRTKGLARYFVTIILLLAASLSISAQEGQKGKTIVQMKVDF